MTRSNLQVKIAHISDLHYPLLFNQGWESEYDELLRSLVEYTPDIIVNTGDLLSTPCSFGYKRFQKHIERLIDGIKRKKSGDVYYVSVPGNHDLFISGFLPFKSKQFHRCHHFLNYPFDKTEEELLKMIHKSFGIALYPLNSSGNKWYNFMSFAQGKLCRPMHEFEKYKAIYEGNGEQIFKIAILHHHPLPLPIEKNEGTESLLILKNAYEFLATSLGTDIDLVLHGHKHKTGVAEYRDLLAQKAIRVYGCGCSCSTKKGDKREYVLLTVDKAGEVSSTVVARDDATGKYKESKERKSIVIPYKEIRKGKAKSKNSYATVHSGTKATCKTKFVNINPAGDAIVDITYDRLEFDKFDVLGSNLLSESVSADVGRIIFWESSLDSEFLRFDPYGTPNHVKMPCHSELHHSVRPEAKNIDVTCTSTHQEKVYYSNIRYNMIGGYTLTKEQHKNLYMDWEYDFRREFCYIFTEFPTDILQLSVKFPSPEFFPSRPRLLALHKNSIGKEHKVFPYLQEDYTVCGKETMFINEKGALIVRANLLQLSAMIRYPQPDLVYLLRWDLPEAQVDRVRMARCKEARQRILSNKKVSEEVYRIVKNAVGSIFGSSVVDVVLLSIGKCDTTGVAVFLMQEGPETYKNMKFFITRGVAGRAYAWMQPVIYNKYLPHNGYIEKVYDGYDPDVAISIPLVIDHNVGETISPESNIYAVVSLVVHRYDSSESTDKAGTEKLISRAKDLFISLNSDVGIKINTRYPGKERSYYGGLQI